MTLKDFKIESFNNKADYTVTAFFQQFDRATFALNFTESQEINALPNFFTEFPRRFFESLWTINHQRTYAEWKTLLIEGLLPQDYKLTKRLELSQKILKKGNDVQKFFDEMENLFQEIDPLMSEEYKIAEIRRAISNISDYQKFVVASKATTVSDIRTLITNLAALKKANTFENTDIMAEKSEVVCENKYFRNDNSYGYPRNVRQRSNSRERYRYDSPKPFREDTFQKIVNNDRFPVRDNRSYSRDRNQSYEKAPQNWRSNSRERYQPDMNQYQRGRTSNYQSSERNNNSGERRSFSRERSRSRNNSGSFRVSDCRIPKSQIDFDSYRLNSGKLFCPWCYDFRHSFNECTKVTVNDMKKIFRKCSDRVREKVQGEYDSYVKQNLDRDPSYWNTNEGKE